MSRVVIEGNDVDSFVFWATRNTLETDGFKKLVGCLVGAYVPLATLDFG